MTDIKQNAKDKFKSIVKADMDAMFNQDLSKEEVDKAVVQEIGMILNEVTVMNNISSTTMKDDIETTEKIKTAENDIANLNKQLKVRQDLGMAA